MTPRRTLLKWAPLVPLIALAGCAAMAGHDPVQVQVVGLDALPGEGLELRFLVKLRVQNPNDTPIEYNGVYVELEVRGSSFATGVSDASGVIGRYGEAVLEIPVTASALRFAGQAIGMYMSSERSKIDYVLRGKIGGPGFGSVRFASKGVIPLPTELSGAAAASAPK